MYYGQKSGDLMNLENNEIEFVQLFLGVEILY